MACSKQLAQLELKVMERAIQSGAAEPELHFIVISDEQQFAEVYDKIHAVAFQKPSRPEIDFDQQRALVAFMGQQSTAGYEINFVPTVRHEADTIEVTVQLQTLSPTAVAAQVMTSPYVLAVIEHGSYRNVRFVDENRELLAVVEVR